MTLFYLIRHGDNDSVGQGISGRRAGIHLNARGRAEAEELARRLQPIGMTRLCSSPLERTRETAAPIAAQLGLEVEVLHSINEVDFGQWTGAPFSQLDEDPHWRRFNRVRSLTRIPDGERMLDVQARMISMLEHLRAEEPEGRIALVSHGDPIRVTLAYYLGLSLDLMHNLHVAIASVSVLGIDDDGARVLCLNHTGPVPGA